MPIRDHPKPRPLLTSYDLERQLARLEALSAGSNQAGWPYVGLRIGYPLLEQKLDGIHNAIYLLASAARMGKTSFALQLVYDLLQRNPTCRVLYITLDQPAWELNVRLVALAGECSADYVQNPTVQGIERYDAKRQKGLVRAGALKGRLTIVDESVGALTLQDVQSLIKQARGKGRAPLVCVIDPVYKIRARPRQDDDLGATSEILARELTTIATSQDIAIVATTRLAQGAGQRRPLLADLEGQAALLYAAKAVMLFYCDFYNNGNTPFLEWEWGTDDVMVPIWELNLAKNRMGSYSGRLFYRFYNSFSKFKECSQLEVDNYERMIKNLKTHDKKDPEPSEDSIQPYETLDESNT